MSDVNKVQVGGDHYKTSDYQPWDFFRKMRLGYTEAALCKYVIRHARKKGAEDLMKAEHCAAKLLEVIEGGAFPQSAVGDAYALDAVYPNMADEIADEFERFATMNNIRHWETDIVWQLITCTHEHEAIKLIDAIFTLRRYDYPASIT